MGPPVDSQVASEQWLKMMVDELVGVTMVYKPTTISGGAHPVPIIILDSFVGSFGSFWN